MEKGALISECGRFRYRLWRRWDGALPTLAFVMLNPSTADASEDDATVRKCIGFAKRLGYGAIEVVNLYAFRARYPSDLQAAGFPVGPDNDTHIEWVVAHTGRQVICAWGNNARGHTRATEVLRMLREWGVTPKALRLNAGGIPAHPVMLPYTCKPLRLRRAGD
ncbi:DUF1643 domain-containing protein [Curvibacter sp. APW13]|uniref:DUF1643 domain-containing protein n=1 Tax=Curvibacter sp. APW13 TaxID=3077236 RepID=UPI0039657BF7